MRIPLTSRNVRIAVVVNDAAAPSETFIRSLVSGLSEHGFATSAVVAGRRSALNAAARHPVTAARYAARAAGLTGVRTRDRLRALVRGVALAAVRPDVVVFSFSGIAVAYLDVLRALDVRVVVSCLGTAEHVAPLVDPRRADALRKLFALDPVVHCVSEEMEVVVRGYGARRTVVVRPAIDTATFSAVSPRPQWRAPYRLLSVGRLHWVKGHEVALEAIALLHHRGCPVEYVIIGDGPERPRLVWHAHRLGVTDSVQFAGLQPPAVVRDEIMRAHLFLQTSYSEGISNAVLEALAMGAPVVVTDVGGMTEAVQHGVHGLVVPPGSPAHVADAVEHLLANPRDAERMASAGAARVRAEFDRSEQISDFVRLIESVLQ